MVLKVPTALHDGGCDKDHGGGSSVSYNISGGSGQVLMLSIYMQSSITSTSTEQHIYTHHYFHHD